MNRPDSDRITALEHQVRALQGLGVGQAALNAMLVGLLVQNGVLTMQQGAMVTVASKDAMERAANDPTITPDKIADWITSQIRTGRI